MSQASSLSDSRRREKPILSCTFCRGRKTRCDRESPCGTCLQRGRAAECTYATPEQERKGAIDYRPHHGRSQARQRFARLESLVLEMRDRELSRNSAQTPTAGASPSLVIIDSRPATPPTSDLTDDMGKLSITDDHAVYTGSSHWVTILEDLRRLKDELSTENDDYSRVTLSDAPTPIQARSVPVVRTGRVSLLSYAPYLTRDDILAMLPPRKMVDRHVSHFFNAFDMAPFLIHRKRFLAEYAGFWDNPSAAPIMWVGLLFSALATSVLLQLQDFGAPGSFSAELQGSLETYRTATIHCLVAGDYLQQSRYTMETLSLHFAVDHNHNLDASINNWFLLGVVIRIAMRMGLHRDPSHWPTIQPLQAELRRRMWITLYQMDFFTSTQVGLPRIIKDSQCDTRAPAHLFEQDLGVEDSELPPERPRDEHTALLFIVERHAVIKVAAEIYDTTEAGPPSPATISQLNAKIQQVIANMPPWLKYKPPEAFLTESPVTILQQIFMDILINKAIYLLHRRSFVKGAEGGDSVASNRICINAALAILAHQRRMSEETKPGGVMFDVRWKVSASLNHELLQATMMLCFALSRSSIGITNADTLLRRDDIVEALTHAKAHWEEIADQSVDARRAAQAITAVLRHDSNAANAPHHEPAADGFFDPLAEMGGQDYLDAINYGLNLSADALDPSFFNESMPTFDSMLDNFVTEQGALCPTWPARET